MCLFNKMWCSENKTQIRTCENILVKYNKASVTCHVHVPDPTDGLWEWRPELMQLRPPVHRDLTSQEVKPPASKMDLNPTQLLVIARTRGHKGVTTWNGWTRLWETRCSALSFPLSTWLTLGRLAQPISAAVFQTPGGSLTSRWLLGWNTWH